MPFEENLDVFFQQNDFAVEAKFNGETAKVLFDSPDDFVGDQDAMTTQYQIVYKAGVFGGLKYGDVITVDGESYTVHQPQKIQDGKLMATRLTKS